MESCSLQSSTIASTMPTSLTKCGSIDKSSLHGQFLRFPKFSKHPHARKLKNVLDIKPQPSGPVKFSSGAVEAVSKEVDLKDANVVFVAGATGRVGSRAVRELLKLGFQVRAGVRSAQKAEALVQSVKEIKLDVEGAPAVERLEIVECDLESPNQIGSALGNASVVLCCIGASEKEVFDVTGPYRIDYQATKNLIDAATVAKVNHFIMVSSLGTNKVGFPAAILNLFWGVLIWKRKAEEALIASGIPYTIVRPGGMERPTDAYKETHNITLSEEDTLFGGQVSNLQVAELMAFMAKNPGLSYCKVVEVIAETTAPLTPFDNLLEKIPSQRIKPKEIDASDKPEPVSAPSKNIVSEATSPAGEEAQIKATATQRLSPYTVYDDLKPPTSPTPTQPNSKKDSANPVEAASKPDTLDTPPGTAPVIAGKQPAPVETKQASPLSPYFVYDDLKPPTSPSPTAPVGSVIPTSTKDVGSKMGNNAPPAAPINEQHHTKPKPRPLSPYAMYEDLKPPTSPTPSLKL